MEILSKNYGIMRHSYKKNPIAISFQTGIRPCKKILVVQGYRVHTALLVVSIVEGPLFAREIRTQDPQMSINAKTKMLSDLSYFLSADRLQPRRS